MIVVHCVALGALVFNGPLLGYATQGAGMVLSGMMGHGLWPAFGVADLAHVKWGIIAGLVPELASVVMLTPLCLVITVNGLELSSGAEIDLDREFRASGLAFVGVAFSGSVPGCHSYVFTVP